MGLFGKKPKKQSYAPEAQNASTDAAPVAEPPPPSVPEFADPEDATRWKMVHVVHTGLEDLMAEYQRCFEKAEKVEKAFGMANAEFVDGVRQHEISREHFRTTAVKWEEELTPMLAGLRASTASVQDQWSNLLFLLPGTDQDFMRVFEWCQSHGVESEILGSIGGNGILIHTDFGTSRQSFWEENSRIETLAKSAG